MTQIPLWLLELFCQYLPLSDLAHLARTSRAVNSLVIPYLYRTVHFHCPGRIDFQDNVLQKLEAFADPRFPRLLHTTHVLVTGSWYDTYKEIESDLSPHKILSPAVRMFNSLISSCVVRMPHLKVFIWDMQVSLTQALITSIMEQPSLEFIQLRLGTNSTPKPFFHPTLEFHQPTNVKVMRFVQVNDPEILQSISLAVSRAVHLQELSVQADADSNLGVDSLFASCNGRCAFQLRFLDLRGFDAIGMTPHSFWNMLSPSNIRELTLHLGEKAQLTEHADFWNELTKAGLRPRLLSSNMAIRGLKDFLLSFTGLEVFSVTPPLSLSLIEPLPLLLQALQDRHSATIKALAININDNSADYTLDIDTIGQLSAAFPGIEELRFGLIHPNLQIVKASLCSFRLRTLHILHTNGVDTKTKWMLQNSVLQYLDQGYTSDLKYIIFDDGPVSRIVKESNHHRLQKQSSIGHVNDSILLQDRTLNWVRNV